MAPCDVTTCCYPLLSLPSCALSFRPSSRPYFYSSRSRSRILLLQGVVNGSRTEDGARVRKSKSASSPKAIANNIRNDSRSISRVGESAENGRAELFLAKLLSANLAKYRHSHRGFEITDYIKDAWRIWQFKFTKPGRLNGNNK